MDCLDGIQGASRVEGVRVQGLGFRVWGLGVRVQATAGLGVKAPTRTKGAHNLRDLPCTGVNRS